ncbi:MAG: hypothetical protein QMD85_02015 [Candidatus Aenigmarchaeota archaeon]|nr:hypothetical protein [Candidatus Aenigmarchaeota archaeon]MDI6722325.1 hypothetical protein [Candidatus Aenigmarchaeota archaeon]
MSHEADSKLVDTTEIHKFKVAYVTANTVRTDPVSRLVETGGFSFPLIDGISAIMNSHIPTVKM